MALKARIRRLQVDMEWMRWWGRLRRVELQMELLARQRAIEAAQAKKRDVAPPAARPGKKIVKPIPPRPEARRQQKRLEPREPAKRSRAEDDREAVLLATAPLPMPLPLPMPGQQPTSERSADLQMRPVQWRHRGPDDWAEDEEHDYSRCLVDYDVMADEED
jgi:hypothetical protein